MSIVRSPVRQSEKIAALAHFTGRAFEVSALKAHLGNVSARGVACDIAVNGAGCARPAPSLEVAP